MCSACGDTYLIHHAEAKAYDDFVNLHMHSSYSLLDGLSKIEDVIKKVASLKQTSFAITEHGNAFSSVKAHKLAKENNLKHIYGMEAYITEDRFVKNKEKRYYHLTLLAKNEKGRLNLNKLASLGYLEGFYYKPRIDHELLSKYSEGIIVLSGCMASELQQAIAGGKIGDDDINITEYTINNARKIVKWYREVFGEDYYLEVQAHRDFRQQKINRAIVDLAKEYNIPYVATTDSHFVNEEDQELHSIFIQIGTNREAGETYEDTHIMGAEEVVRKLISDNGLTLDESVIATKTSLVIADKCNVNLPLSEAIIPHIDVPNQFDGEIAYLQNLINKGWKKREINKKPVRMIKDYKERLNYEFNAISKMGFEGYFLFVDSYVNSVSRRGIARGSAGGSLIAYLLSITEIDPIPYGLYFERFIDVSAVDLLESGQITRKQLKIPDIDSDFSPLDRDKVEEFIIKKYGGNKYASLGQFGYIWDKSAIKDVGRVLKIPYAITNQISKELGDLTIEYALEVGMFKSYVEMYPKLFEYAQKLAGTPRSYGVHPCARVVFNKDVEWHIPVAMNDGTVVIQGDMHDAEDVGATKTDLLGLKSLDVIYDVLDMIGEDYDYISPDKIDFNDEKVLNLFREGKTDGIFQFESVGMKDMLRKMKPDGIEDLGVANALFRPSSMKFIDHYAKRKFGLEEVDYLHPDLEKVLGDTYGIFVYQEQLITLGRLANMSNPDLIRQGTGKKDMKKMLKAKTELFEGLTIRGWNDEQLESLWQIMIDFASYSFNKSHALAYAMTAFQMAKLKVYHPKEFMVALLNSKIGKTEDLSNYISECVRMGIEVKLPSINESEGNFTIKGESILFGLLGIKSVGEPTVELIQSYRNYYQGSFETFESFYIFMNSKNNLTNETIASDALLNLIKSGAFGGNRLSNIKEFAKLTYTPLKFKEVISTPSWIKIKEMTDIEESYFKSLDREEKLTLYNELRYEAHIKKNEQRLDKHLSDFEFKYVKDPEMYEFETIGCFLTVSPYYNYMNIVKDFYSYEDNEEKVLMIGTVLSKTVKKASRGGQYAKLSLLTPYGVVKGMCYSHQYSEYKDKLEKGENLVLLVKRNNDQFILSQLRTFDDWRSMIDKKRESKI